MPTAELSVVTGAFGYTGRYIAQQLLSAGQRVPNPHQPPRPPRPLRRAGGRRSAGLRRSPGTGPKPGRCRKPSSIPTGSAFPRGQVTYDSAVRNSTVLIKAAEAAGVGKIVHISITGASSDSPLPYFQGKGPRGGGCEQLPAVPRHNQAPRWSSGGKMSSSTTSPGLSGDSPCSLYSARGVSCPAGFRGRRSPTSGESGA